MIPVDPREYRRLHEDASRLAELRGLWRQMHDYGSTFTTPRERIAASDRFRHLIGDNYPKP